MKAIEQFVEELVQSGVRVWVEDGGLKYNGPDEVVTPSLMQNMKLRKDELQDHLLEK